jgi:hypothetical protein
MKDMQNATTSGWHAAGLGIALLTAAALVPAFPASAQELPPAVEALLGDWEGTGTLMGREAHFGMKWELALGGRFVRLTFRNAFVVDGEEQVVLTAEAFYHVVSDTALTGTWFDSRGLVLPLAARVETDQLVTAWGDASTERGTTRYRITDDGVEVVDTVTTDAGEREFGRAVYRRR